jgi:hypothetical protein
MESLSSFKQVTCKKCGQVYVGVPRKWAEEEIINSTRWLDEMAISDPKGRSYFGDPPKLVQYEYCWCKNHYKNFRAFKKGDCPDGCTLSSIIKKSD